MYEPFALDAGRIGEIIHSQFPELRADQVSHLGEGYDSAAFEVDHRWVFRFPKRRDVARQLLLEMSVLPVLAEFSPIPVPAFRFRGRPSVPFPRHFGGYAKLPGTPAIRIDPHTLPFDRLAPELARFLSWLHTFPVAEAKRLGMGSQDVTLLVEESRAEALGDLENVRRVADAERLVAWRAYFARGPGASARAHESVLIHADFAAEHVLCDPATRAPTGVIDWSEMAVGDAALDFAGLFHWGGTPLVDAVLSSYEAAADDGMLRRAQFFGACRGAGDVTFGLETGRREYIAGGLRALELCIGG